MEHSTELLNAILEILKLCEKKVKEATENAATAA